MTDFSFTDDDRGKDVVTSDGTTIGTIKHVYGQDRATVERDDHGGGLTQKIKEMLGWTDDESDENRLQSDYVDRAETDRIFLHRD